MRVIAQATPPAGGYDNVPWTVVDLTDGSWTLTDPDNLVKSGPTHAAGFNNVVFNALGSGSQDYSWAAGANFRAPRWSKALTASDGNGGETQIQSGDTFLLQVRMTKGTTTAEFDTEVICASSADGTALTAAAFDGQGGVAEWIATGNQGYGAFTSNAKSASTHANNVAGVMTAHHAGAYAQGVVYTTLQASGAAQAGGTRNSAITYSASDIAMDLVVGIGTRGIATIDADDDVDIKIEYRVIKMGE